jgi:hypothetical protein
MSLNACRIYLKADRARLIVLTFKDITEHEKIDELRKKIAVLDGRLRKQDKKR